jgi:molecular chaperone GrpE
LAAAEGSDGTATLRDGVRLAYENLMKALGDHGLEAIDALNEKFDPSVHNAIMQAATSEHLPGVVIEQVARGYRLRDRVLRAAMVIVSKAADDALGE